MGSVIIAVCCFAGLVGGCVFAYLIYGKIYTKRDRDRRLEEFPFGFDKNYRRYMNLANFVCHKYDRPMTDSEFVEILTQYVRFMREYVLTDDDEELDK